MPDLADTLKELCRQLLAIPSPDKTLPQMKREWGRLRRQAEAQMQDLASRGMLQAAQDVGQQLQALLDQAEMDQGAMEYLAGNLGQIGQPSYSVMPQDVLDAYATLKIKPGTNLEHVEQAYRERVKVLRPDLGHDSGEFIQVKAAVDLLRRRLK